MLSEPYSWQKYVRNIRPGCCAFSQKEVGGIKAQSFFLEIVNYVLEGEEKPQSE